jgi:RNA-directed DNA polymerase
MVRYADDFVVLCRSESEAVSALAMLRDSVEAAGLTLHPTNTRIVDSRSESFAFLGYSFRGEKIYPRRESLSKIKARLVQSTARTRSGSIEAICMELTSVLRGWFYYFRHCRWTISADLDSKIRSRLRRLLLRRHRNNPTRSPRQERRPNDYFTKAGLFSLRAAHNRFGQSRQGHY